MDTETEYLIGQLDEPEEIICGNWKFYTGFLGKHAEPVVISRTYQGMVNAAAATAIAMTQFCLWAVINLGLAEAMMRGFIGETSWWGSAWFRWEP